MDLGSRGREYVERVVRQWMHVLTSVRVPHGHFQHFLRESRARILRLFPVLVALFNSGYGSTTALREQLM